MRPVLAWSRDFAKSRFPLFCVMREARPAKKTGAFSLTGLLRFFHILKGVQPEKAPFFLSD